MRTYEAALTRPDNVAQVKAAAPSIKRIGGTVQISAPTADGVTLVVVTLPQIYRIEDILPGLPFYSV
jgi:hypothetical protein